MHSFDTTVNFQEAKPGGELYKRVGFFVVACWPGKFQRDVELIALLEVRHCLAEDKVLAQAMRFQFVAFQSSFLHLPIEGDDSGLANRTSRLLIPLNICLFYPTQSSPYEASPPKSANLDPSVEEETI